MTEITVFKNRDFGELISDSISFFVQEIKLLLKTLLFILGPFILLTSVLGIVFNVGVGNQITQLIDIFKGSANNIPQANPSGSALIGLISIFQNIMLYVVTGVYVKLYAKKGRGNFDIEDVWSEVKIIYWNVLGVQFLAGIIIIGGLLLLIIPAIYLGVVVSIAFAIIIFENIGAGSAISRSFELMKGNWWKSFGAYIVLGLLTSIASAVFAGLVGLIFIASTNSVISAIYTILVGFSSVIFSVVLILLAVFLYASYVSEKENPSLLERISNISKNESNDFEKEENDNEKDKNITVDEDVWSKLIDDNKAKTSTPNETENTETDPPKETKKDNEQNRFIENDDDINRFKPKY